MTHWISPLATLRIRNGLAIVALISALSVGALPLAADEASVANGRIFESIKYLASDQLEGRGIGTKGLDAAADYVAAQFASLGLNTRLFEGGPFQKFTVTADAQIGAQNHLALVGPAAADPAFDKAATNGTATDTASDKHTANRSATNGVINKHATNGSTTRSANDRAAPPGFDLIPGRSFTPLAISGSAKFDLPLIFVGYGITAKDGDYDDYAGLDVKGKAVLILRHHPRQRDVHSALAGHAPLKRKISNAYEHGAAAVLLCSDAIHLENDVEQLSARWRAGADQLAEANASFNRLKSPTEPQRREHQQRVERLAEDAKSFADRLAHARDPLLAFDSVTADGEGRDIPVLAISRRAAERLVQAALGKELKSLEASIDRDLAPQSRALAGWRAVGQTSVRRQEVEVKNVVATLDGAGPKADEAVVIGAHYDHLGWGGENSAAPGVHEIHNGADDNASGTTALFEVARMLAARDKKLPRTIVFIAFTGEERGLLGSSRYVSHPLVPLDKTIAMFNMDMVGRLRDDKLIVHGSGTATSFDALIDHCCAEHGFHVTKKPGGFGPSDHSPFYGKQIPVLFFFTGSHSDYHRPTDDYDKVNVDGVRRVSRMVADVAAAVASAAERPRYVEIKETTTLGGDGDRPYFGSIPDFAADKPGYALMGVGGGSPAERAGIRGGDVIVQLGDSRIGGLEDFDSALRKFKAGDRVKVVVRRGEQTRTIEVTLDPPRN